MESMFGVNPVLGAAHCFAHAMRQSGGERVIDLEPPKTK
jgi:hypothetical protein